MITKQELTDDMTVHLENGSRGTIFGEDIMWGASCTKLKYYDNALRRKRKPHLDIVKVFDKEGNKIWDRADEPCHHYRLVMIDGFFYKCDECREFLIPIIPEYYDKLRVDEETLNKVKGVVQNVWWATTVLTDEDDVQMILADYAVKIMNIVYGEEDE